MSDLSTRLRATAAEFAQMADDFRHDAPAGHSEQIDNAMSEVYAHAAATIRWIVDEPPRLPSPSRGSIVEAEFRDGSVACVYSQGGAGFTFGREQGPAESVTPWSAVRIIRTLA